MRQRLGIPALVAFVVLDIVLVVLAVRHAHPAPPKEPPIAASTPSSHPTHTKHPTKSPSTVTSPSPSKTAKPRPKRDRRGPVLMSIASDGTILRATIGNCHGLRPFVTVSVDGGATFTRAKVAPALSHVTGVDAHSKKALRVAGTTPNCKPQLYVGAAGPALWKPAAKDLGTWHKVVGRTATVHAPQGNVSTPCTPAYLAGNTPVRVLCTDGQIYGTDTHGSTWIRLGALSNASAIAYSSPGRGYALASLTGCSNALMVTNDSGTTWTEASCLGTGRARGIAASSTSTGDQVLVQVDKSLRRSIDGGRTFTTLS
jgi:hypothetical protein